MGRHLGLLCFFDGLFGVFLMGTMKYTSLWLAAFFLVLGSVCAYGAFGFGGGPASYTLEGSFTVSAGAQHAEVAPGAKSALALKFEVVDKWHFYADNSQVPAGKLTVTGAGEGIVFDEAIFPASHLFDDKVVGASYEIYDGKFTVFLPFAVAAGTADGVIAVAVKIDGAVCADVCIPLRKGRVATNVAVRASASMADAAFELPPPVRVGRKGGLDAVSFSMPVAFGLAIVAGLLLNVMPCVWPIIPIIVTRLWNLSGQSRKKSTAMGITFCSGILLFFAAIAVANIVLRVGYNEVFQWGDHYRNPSVVMGMSLLMMVLALFMFGVFNVSLPSSVTSKAGGAKGAAGTVGMGFLLALLSTPCSFAILGAVFLWAQTQELLLATVTIMLIGVGMAIPYLFLTSVPGLLSRLPRAGAWMDRVKQAMGFLLLLVAVKLFSAIPVKARVDTLYYAVLLAFCVWVWGGWVSYSTSRGRKLFVRAMAVVLAVAGGWFFLGAGGEKPIDWQEYDSGRISEAIEEGQPVLIKFTADWCTICSVVERLVYMRADVGDLVKKKGVLAFIGDTTFTNSAATRDFKFRYKEPGVPVTVIHLPDGREEHLVGMIGAGDVMEILMGLKDTDGEEEDQGR